MKRGRKHKRRVTFGSAGTLACLCSDAKHQHSGTIQFLMERRIGGNATDCLHHYSRIFSANRTLNIELIAATPIKKIATVSKFARETCPA